MEGFATGFLTGFMGDQAQKISNRKQEANDFFSEQMRLAHKVAGSVRNKYKPQMDASLQVAKQLMAIGVPERTVMAIANQNPDDLPQFYETVQKMQMEGVDTTDPEFYDELISVDTEFNPGNENITSLLSRIYSPLTSNIKSDPESFKFDKKGTIWATMMGYNAMDNAYNRLENTNVLGDMSAADVLAMEEAGPAVNPLGSNSVTLNAPMAGNETRAARERLQGGGELTISQRGTVLSQFDKLVSDEMLNLSSEESADIEQGGLSPEDRMTTARQRAAIRTIESFPEAIQVPEISRYLVAPERASPEANAPESPVEGATGAVGSPATPLPETSQSLPSTLPSGATLIKDNGDGTSDWKTVTGQIKTYNNGDVINMMKGQQLMTPPQTSAVKPVIQQTIPDWLNQSRPENPYD